jgi:AraC-like DNA-binding protein
VSRRRLPDIRLRAQIAKRKHHTESKDQRLHHNPEMTGWARAVKHKAFSEEKESRHQITLRMDESRQLLRETKKSVVDVALDVGYANPSHFAQLFRRETGLSPSDYRRQR